MNSRRFRLGMLALACIAQLGLVGGMLARAELTLSQGEPFRFETAPIDPVDLFRGRYVQLNFPQVNVPLERSGQRKGPEEEAPKKGSPVYVEIEVDDHGFARFARAHSEAPSHDDYLRLPVLSASARSVTVRLPYERFYMEEERAPEVEREVRDRAKRSWAVVRIRRGHGVVEDLVVATRTDAPSVTRP